MQWPFADFTPYLRSMCGATGLKIFVVLANSALPVVYCYVKSDPLEQKWEAGHLVFFIRSICGAAKAQQLLYTKFLFIFITLYNLVDHGNYLCC